MAHPYTQVPLLHYRCASGAHHEAGVTKMTGSPSSSEATTFIGGSHLSYGRSAAAVAPGQVRVTSLVQPLATINAA